MDIRHILHDQDIDEDLLILEKNHKDRHCSRRYIHIMKKGYFLILGINCKDAQIKAKPHSLLRF